MTVEENKEDDCIVCWSCKEVITLRDRSENDGFCPLCNQEIELDDH